MKKFSFEIILQKVFTNGKQLAPALKQGLENLMSNLKKLIEKEKKKKTEETKENKKANRAAKDADLISMYTTKTSKSLAASNYNEVEDLLKESDSEDDEAQLDSKSHKTLKSTKSSKSEKEKKRGDKKSKHPMAWIQEDENEDPIDLLDPMTIKNVLATKPLTRQQILSKQEKVKNAKSKNRGFKMDSDGKLMIDDDDDADDEETGVELKTKRKSKPDEIEEMMDTLSLSKKSLAASRKSKRTMEHDSDEEDNDDKRSKTSYRTGGTGIHRRVNKNERAEYGAEYKAKKARGDVKRKNKPDPYAYIPFDYNKLNKRKRAKLQGEFKGIVKAVNRGASKAKTKRLS